MGCKVGCLDGCPVGFAIGTLKVDALKPVRGLVHVSALMVGQVLTHCMSRASNNALRRKQELPDDELVD